VDVQPIPNGLLIVVNGDMAVDGNQNALKFAQVKKKIV